MKYSAKILALICGSLSIAAWADWKQTGKGPYAYDDPANWTDGVPNGVFATTLTTDQTITFSNDTSIATLKVAFGGGKKYYFQRDPNAEGDVTLSIGALVYAPNQSKSGGALYFGSSTEAAKNLTAVKFDTTLNAAPTIDSKINAVYIYAPITGNGDLTVTPLASFLPSGTVTLDGTLTIAGTGAATFSEDVSAKAIAFTGTSNQLTFNKGVAVEETITLASTKNTMFAATSSITKGKLVVAAGNTGSVYLRGTNSYAGGTEVIGTGAVSADSSTAFGTGPVTFNAGTKLNASYDVTLENDNAFFFNDSFSFTGGKELDLGNGPITLAKPIKITCGGTLNLRGAFQGAYGVQDIEKDGKSTILRLYQDFTADPTKTVKVTQGYLELYGKMTGSSLKVTNSSGILRLHTAFDNDTLPAINITAGTVEVYSHLEQPETITTTGAGTLKICSDLEYDTLTVAPETGLLYLEGALSGNKLIFANKVNTTVNGVIASGAVEVRSQANLYLYGANEYTGGTDIYCAGDGAKGLCYIGSPTAFGTGEVRFNTGARLSAASSVTMTANNKFVFNASAYFSADGKVVNLGSGDIELGENFQRLTIEKGTFRFDGQFVGERGMLEFVKNSNGILNLGGDFTIPDDAEITNCAGGSLQFYGTITANSILKRCAGNVRFFGPLVLPEDAVVIKHLSGSMLSFNEDAVLTASKLTFQAASSSQLNVNTAWANEGDLELEVLGSYAVNFTEGSSITGGKLVKTGPTTAVLSGTNGWTGGTDIQAGRLIFNSAAPETGTILLAEGTELTGSAICPVSGLLASDKIDPASSGVLALGSDETASIDLSAYPNLTLGTSQQASVLTGQITLPATGLRLGGTTALTLASENALVGSADVTIVGNVTFLAANTYAGTITVESGKTLKLDEAGAFPQAEIVTQCGTVQLGALTEGGTITRMKNLTMQSGRIELLAATGESETVNRIPELVLTTSEVSGGTPNLAGAAGHRLSVGTLSRLMPVLFNVSGDGLGETWRVSVDNGLANVGDGTPGTAAQPVVPWLRNAGHIMYLNADNEILALDAMRRTEYTAEAPGGTPVLEKENMFVATGLTTHEFTPNPESGTTALDFTSIDLMQGSASSWTRVSTPGSSISLSSGALALSSSNNSNTQPGTFIVSDLLDAGTNTLYVSVRQNYNNMLSCAVAGSNGMVIGDAGTTYSTSRGLYFGGTGSTFTGDVYVFGSLYLGGTNVLPFGDRSGDLYLYGNFYLNMVTIKINALNGTGRLAYGNSSAQSITIGTDGSDGDYGGTVENTFGSLNLVKDGAGVQRFSKTINTRGSVSANAGTLQLDGLFYSSVSDSGSLNVGADGRLTGCGESEKNVVVKGTLEPGSEGGKVFTVSNEKDLTFFDGSSFAVAVDADGATNVKVAGAVVAKRVSGKSEVEDPSVEIPVVVTGSKSGRFKILEASDINATFTCADKYKTLEVVSNVETGRKELWLTSASKSLLIIVR